jgi:hypothetical protein
MTDEVPQIEVSPLSCTVTRDDLTVDGLIYRLAAEFGSWTLQSVDEEQTSKIWEDIFDTDPDAYIEFCDALQTDGIRSFFEQPPSSTKR